MLLKKGLLYGSSFFIVLNLIQFSQAERLIHQGRAAKIGKNTVAGFYFA